jgi:hypothetical protein
MQRRIKCKLGFQMGVGWGVGFEIQAYVWFDVESAECPLGAFFANIGTMHKANASKLAKTQEMSIVSSTMGDNLTERIN